MVAPEDEDKVSVLDQIDEFLGSDEEDKDEEGEKLVTKKRNGSSSWLQNTAKKR